MTGIKKMISRVLLIMLGFFTTPTANESAPKTFWAYQTMTHAMGTYENNTYCNHEEALKDSIAKGQKFIEVDAILTEDEALVMSHGWDKYSCTFNGIPFDASNIGTMTYDEFIGIKLYGRYHTMDAKGWSKYVEKYTDIFWEMDLRTLEADEAAKTAQAIVDTFEGKEECLDRVLIQVASEEMHQAMNEVYNFPHYQYFTNQKTAWYLESITEYCVENGIESIALPNEYSSEYFISIIKEKKLHILSYTIDDKDRAIELLNNGVDTVCTNFLIESDLY